MAPPTGTDSDRLLAALQNGQDPFDNLDPTAALVAGGAAMPAVRSFVRPARVVESTSPLTWPTRAPARPHINLLTPAGLAGNNNAPANDPPVAGNDTNTTTEKSFVTGNILTNDTDPNGDAVFIQSVAGTPMATGGGDRGRPPPAAPSPSCPTAPTSSIRAIHTTTWVPANRPHSSITYTVSDPLAIRSTATVSRAR